jgi:formate/nitrite transporter
LVYLGNLAGATVTALLVFLSGTWALGDHAVGLHALRIAAAKCELGWLEAFTRGVLCNALVCLAVWLCHSGRSTTDRILAILWPITGFVAMGFEHSIANLYFIPLGLLLQGESPLAQAALAGGIARIDAAGFAANLIPVTLGNVVGGTLLVAGVYWLAYLRRRSEGAPKPTGLAP